jgi:DNA-binding SARP family transcriptional activator/pimeloyl-ACP methyl ester carboxylesterase
VRVDVRLLGSFAVVVDGRPVPADAWGRKHAAALVKLLALAPSHRLHREQVLDALWPDVGPGAAGPRLHKAAHYARRALGAEGGIVLARESVALFPGADVVVDVTTFEQAAGAGDLERAFAAYTGPLLPDDQYEDWAFLPRERLELRYREVLRAARRWDDLVALDPTDEEAHVGKIEALLEAGDRAGARRQFEVLERILRDELGIGPSAESVAVFGRAREEAATAVPAERAPRHSDLASQSIRFCRTRDGVRLAYALSGEGPVLVKASNWLTHLDYDWASPVWGHWWRGLSQGRTLVRYDERGCGMSDWDVDQFDLDAWVTDLETVVDTLGLERFPLLGISQGGAIAIRYAVRHPERVTRIVLYGSAAKGRRVRVPDAETQAQLDALVALMRVAWGSNNPLFHTLFNGLFMPNATPELWHAFDELQQKTASPENAARLWDAFQRADVEAEAATLDVPTLVLHARSDLARPYEYGEELAGLIPGSRLVPLDSPNHILQQDEPAFGVFLDAVQEFLAEDA